MALTRVKGKVLQTSVDTINDLPTTGYDGQAIVVNHYHSDVEGGGGTFIWANEAKSTHNGGTIIDPTAVFPTDWNNQTQLGTWFDTANAGTGVWKRQYTGTINIQDFGAKGDDSTNNTVALNVCINLGVDVYVPPGIFLGNLKHTTGFISIKGSGVNSILKSYTANGYALCETMLNYGWSTALAISDLSFFGDDADRNGFSFGDPENEVPSESPYYGRCNFTNVTFVGCKVGTYKPYGSIGNLFTRCNWVRGDFGVLMRSTESQHTGNDSYNTCEFNSQNIAGMAILEVSSGIGSTNLNNCVFEGILGVALFVKNTYGTIELNNCYFELVSMAGDTVTIDSVEYPNKYIVAVNALCIYTSRCTAYNLYSENSNIIENNTGYDTTADMLSTIDSNSVVIADLVKLGIANRIYNRVVRSLSSVYYNPNDVGQPFLASPRTSVVESNRNKLPINFAFKNAYTFYGDTAGKVWYTTKVADSELFDYCAEFDAPANEFAYYETSASITSQKWYVATLDIKLMSDVTSGLIVSGMSPFSYDIFPLLRYNKWVTFASVFKANDTYSSYFPTFNNSTDSNITVRLSALQLLEFDSELEAINYFNSAKYSNGEALDQITIDPTTQNVGVNMAPTAAKLAVGGYGTSSGYGAVFQINGALGAANQNFGFGMSVEGSGVASGIYLQTYGLGTNLVFTTSSDWSAVTPVQTKRMELTTAGTLLIDSATDDGINKIITSGGIKASGFTAGSSVGVSGSFTTADSKTVTVVNGIITSIA